MSSPEPTPPHVQEWAKGQLSLFESKEDMQLNPQRRRKFLLDAQTVGKFVCALGIDLSQHTFVDLTPQKMVELISISTCGPGLRQIYGPNWTNALERNKRLNPALDNANKYTTLEADEFRETASSYTDQIIHCWAGIKKHMRKMQEEGTKDHARRAWALLSKSAKQDWLRKRFPGTIQRTCADITTWAQNKRSAPDSSLRNCFLAPSLNLDDLSEDHLLPNFLETRAQHHPGLFRRHDARSVPLGLWSGGLEPLSVEGVLSFPPDAELQETEEYSCSLETRRGENGLPASPQLPNEALPGGGLYQLESQMLIYKFLLACSEYFLQSFGLGTVTTEGSQNCIVRDKCLSLLTRCSQDMYSGHPGSIDVAYIRKLVESSLGDVLDDFWLVRADPLTWANRMRSIPTRAPGRTESFLRTHLYRIDIFHTLCRHMNTLFDSGLSDAQHIISQTPAEKREMLWCHISSLRYAIQFAYEETLGRFGEMVWSIPDSFGAVPLQLVDVLKANDPDIRLMHLPTVMKVIDQGYQGCTLKAEVPFTITQLLNDLSVIGACRQEMIKFYSLVPSGDEYVRRIATLEGEWKNQDRPWSSAMRDTLAGISKEDYQRLDGNCHSDSGRHHITFWSAFDKSMKAASQQNDAVKRIYEEIQKTMPIRTAGNQNVGSRPPDPFVKGSCEPNMPTLSQLKRSKGSAVPQPLAHHSTEAQPVIEPKPQLLSLTPNRQKDFWTMMLSGSIKPFRWSKWVQGMQDLGFEAIPQAGSSTRFDLRSKVCGGTACAIVYHKPHNRAKVMPNEGKIWVQRLLKRLTIEIVEDKDDSEGE